MLKKITLNSLLFIGFVLLLAACGDDTSTESGDAASNDSFPENPVELVVPFDAGGGTDSVARSLASNTEKHFDESIPVMNVSGGGGATGMTQVANEAADGYNLLFATVELTTLPPMGLSEVTHEDFQAIAQINMDPGAITVKSDSEWSDAEEFIEYAREHPGEVSIGNAGAGSIWHLVAASIEKELDVEFNHVPYDGAAPAVTALLSGEVDAVTVSPAEVLTQVEAGDLTTLAVASEERAEVMPDVPTMEEAGLGPIVSGTWRGVVGPKDLPEDIVAELEEAFVKGAEEEEFVEFMQNNGLGMQVNGAEEFQEWMANEANEWEAIITDLGL
ncbi:tripartite tricarboxylate transporter substrate binding protein [Oceanobacillus timonensis]|uniref:tripartite tricarboxylate transporter substrate binding protein n=1 Tax=Oceanobacillus timonensis TaxID=1926285 RepID=UPI0009B9A903|nr:tripartite tricarboxylate transporter substrate binding protein [Oceanobacillus timonensis]